MANVVSTALALLLLVLPRALRADEAPATLEVHVTWAQDDRNPEPLANAVVFADAPPVTPVPLRVTVDHLQSEFMPLVSTVAPGGRMIVRNRSEQETSMRVLLGRKTIERKNLGPGEEMAVNGLEEGPDAYEIAASDVADQRAVVRVMNVAHVRTSSEGAAGLRLAAGEREIHLYHPWVGEFVWKGIRLQPGEVALLGISGKGSSFEARLQKRERVAPPARGLGILMGRVLCAGERCKAALGAEGPVPDAAVSVGEGALAPVAVTDAEGRFRIEGVPVGEQTVDIWHKALGRHSEKTRVAPGAVTVINFAFHDEEQ